MVERNSLEMDVLVATRISAHVAVAGNGRFWYNERKQNNTQKGER